MRDMELTVNTVANGIRTPLAMSRKEITQFIKMFELGVNVPDGTPQHFMVWVSYEPKGD